MFTVSAGRWLTAVVWSFICCWCFRTIRNIFQILIMMTKNIRKIDAIGIKYHLLAIQNLGKTITVAEIHKAIVVWNTRGTVTIVLYRRWRVSARSRSINTAAKMRKETPAVIQADRDWSTFNVQNTAKFSLSSAILCATNNGWHIRPTRRSETARQPKRMNDGEWRSRVFPITNTTIKFPMHVSKEKKEFRIHVTIFVMKTSSVLSKWSWSSKKKQSFSVLFMANKVCRQKAVLRATWTETSLSLSSRFSWSHRSDCTDNFFHCFSCYLMLIYQLKLRLRVRKKLST